MTFSLRILAALAAPFLIYPSVGNGKPTKETVVASSIAQWKASEYVQLEPQIRTAYARGLLGGLDAAAFMGGSPLKVKALQDCTGIMMGETLMLVVDAYVASRPELLDAPMSMVFPMAIMATCKNKNIDIQAK